MRNVSGKRYVGNKAHILCFNNFFQKSCRLWHNVKNMLDLEIQ